MLYKKILTLISTYRASSKSNSISNPLDPSKRSMDFGFLMVIHLVNVQG